jgi:hypothetical protein
MLIDDIEMSIYDSEMLVYDIQHDKKKYVWISLAPLLPLSS